MTNYAVANKLYAERFGVNPPSRVTVQLPLNTTLATCALHQQVTIQAIAYRRAAAVSAPLVLHPSWYQHDQKHNTAADNAQQPLPCSSARSVLHVQSHSEWAPANIGPYAQATQIGGLVFGAGSIGLVPHTMALASPSVWPWADTVLASKATSADQAANAHGHVTDAAGLQHQLTTFLQTHQTWWNVNRILTTMDSALSADTALCATVFCAPTCSAVVAATVRQLTAPCAASDTPYESLDAEAQFQVERHHRYANHVSTLDAAAGCALLGVPMLLLTVPRLPRDANVEIQPLTLQRNFTQLRLFQARDVEIHRGILSHAGIEQPLGQLHVFGRLFEGLAGSLYVTISVDEARIGTGSYSAMLQTALADAIRIVNQEFRGAHVQYVKLTSVRVSFVTADCDCLRYRDGAVLTADLFSAPAVDRLMLSHGMCSRYRLDCSVV